MPKISALSLCAILAALSGCIGTTESDAKYVLKDSQCVKITLNDDAPFHTHRAGSTFVVKVKADYPRNAVIQYQWRDFQSKPITDFVPLPRNQFINIESPKSEAGYYGLVFESIAPNVSLPDREPGEIREYGFGILPTNSYLKRQANPASPFGMVHAAIDDPHWQGWIKTLTWKTIAANQWQAALEQRRRLGKVELPMILELEWDSNDAKPIRQEQLLALQSLAESYFKAEPRALYWELGLEENLKKRYRKPYYWQNLEAKTKIVRRAADSVNRDIKLIYQIAELNLDPVNAFFRSSVARSFDVLSLHPYAWLDFPSPEKWLPGYLTDVRMIQERNRLGRVPIWFTEVGAPHHGNAPGKFFGYPETGKYISGKTLAEAVNYMIKIHVLALDLGVAKVFWYNYKDREPEREYAENHFGLVDYWGFPKPAYMAYVSMQNVLRDKCPAGSKQTGGVRIYRFDGNRESTYVAWSYPRGERLMSWSSFDEMLSAADVSAMFNAVGTPLTIHADGIKIGPAPLFVVTAKKGQINENTRENRPACTY